MIVFSEASDCIAPSASARDIFSMTDAARQAGFRIYGIPHDFLKSDGVGNALALLPKFDSPVGGFWVGYIPDEPRYRDLYGAAAEKNVFLVNTPDEHMRGQRFDLAYPHIAALTPKSVIVESMDTVQEAGESVGFPVFVKGVIQSRKSKGPSACFAENQDELCRIADALFALESRSRGKIVIRRKVQLRHSRKTHDGFPLGREYRVFVYKNQIAGMGYYWEGQDELKKLNQEEESAVKRLAIHASQNLKVPYLTVDIGQLEDETWTVIETGDGQFSGLSQTPIMQLWNFLAAETERNN